jgi:hypothetical protein
MSYLIDGLRYERFNLAAQAVRVSVHFRDDTPDGPWVVSQAPYLNFSREFLPPDPCRNGRAVPWPKRVADARRYFFLDAARAAVATYSSQTILAGIEEGRPFLVPKLEILSVAKAEAVEAAEDAVKRFLDARFTMPHSFIGGA